MPHRTLVLTLPLMLVMALGCNPRNQAQANYTPSADRLQTAGSDSLGIPGATRSEQPARAASAHHGPLNVTLASVQPWSLAGAAVLESYGGLTSVQLSIAGGRPGQHYGASIRRGTCGGPQFYVAGVPPASADSAGRGSSASHAEVPLQDLLDGNHAIVLSHQDETQACGNIPGLLAR